MHKHPTPIYNKLFRVNSINLPLRLHATHDTKIPDIYNEYICGTTNRNQQVPTPLPLNGHPEEVDGRVNEIDNPP